MSAPAFVPLVEVEIRAPLDPERWLEDMSSVQRRVYADALAGAEDVGRWSELLTESNRATAEANLRELVRQHGCNPERVALGETVETTIAKAAESSAASITNTFNYELAREIRNIGEATPRANYRTYRSRLFGDTNNSIYAGQANWAAGRGGDKIFQIAVTETGTTIGASTAAFYANNPDLATKAELRPGNAQCPTCQAGVAGNPYETPAAAQAAGPWPAHPNCVHFIAVDMPKAADCSKLWAGG